MIALFGSMIIGLLAAFLMSKLSKMFGEKKSLTRKRVTIIGVGIALGNFLAIKLPAFLAILLIPVGMAAMVWMFLYWREEGSTFKEALLFFATNLVIAFVLNNATLRVRDLVNIRWLTAMFESLSAVAVVVLLGFLVADMVWFQLFLNDGKLFREEDEDDENDDGRNREVTGDRTAAKA